MTASIIRTLVISSLIASTANAGRIALVNEIDGSATLERGESTSEIELFDRLELDDRLSCAEQCRLVVAFFDGRRVEITGPAEALLGESALDLLSGEMKLLTAVSTLPRISAIAESEAPSAKAGAIRVRSAGDRVVLRVWPGDGELSLAEATVLDFETVEGFTEYRLELENETAEAIFSITSTGEAVSLPSELLEPGANYYWRIVASGPAIKAHGDAFFSTLPSDTAEALSATREELSSGAGDILLLAEIERSLGLVREACTTLSVLGDEAPDFDCP